MKILIDYNCNILYSSQYIEYLSRNYKVSFTKSTFDTIKQKENLFLFSAISNNECFNFVIDFADSSKINEYAYNWCNVYGKINYNSTDGNYTNTEKLIKISPSFGTKIWSDYTAIYYSLLTYLKYHSSLDFKSHLSNYLYQGKRIKLSEYIPHISDNNYIFFVSTLWNEQNHCCDEKETNNYRANFIKACKQTTQINFEGGFAPNINKGIYSEELFIKDRISINEFLIKTKQSACVFNTPAVFSCHGWKLGEYLALGKAIISTPFKNELPKPLEHGINIHYVSGEENEIKDAINKICFDDTYRKKLENGANQYWLDYGHPKNAIINLFEGVNINI